MGFIHLGSGQRASGGFTLIAGTVNDGTYQALVTFPQGAACGTWTVTHVSFRASGNVENRFELSTEQLAALGFPTQLTNTCASQDVTPPRLESFSFTPSAIDTTTGDAIVTATARVTDSQSGVQVGDVGFTHLASGQYVNGIFSLTGGTLRDGTHQALVRFPQFAACGTWTVGNVVFRDNAGNSFGTSTGALAALGFPTELTNTCAESASFIS